MRKLAALVLFVLSASAPARADSPGISRLVPAGGQRGTEIDVVLSGANLMDARELLLYRPGIEVLKLAAADEKSVQLRLRIAADAPLGEHPVRVRTATGISDLRTFNVGPYRAVAEKEPNDKFSEPQAIELDVTVEGVVRNEDVDTFSVVLKKGERLNAEVEGMRLGNVLLDAKLFLFDTKRFELVSNDDSSLAVQDPVLSFIAPEDGTYILQLRESSYGGSDASNYRLHVGRFPRPLVVHPAGGRPGETLEVSFLGDPRGPLRRTITLPAAATARHPLLVEEDGRIPPSPNWVRVVDAPNVLEVEPNDALAQATATELPLPVAFCGIIGKEGDEDWFRFKAKKGDAYEIRAHARSIRSPLDPVLYVHGADGKVIGTNDDQGGPDAVLKFSAPADGEYGVRVRDHLRKGGPLHVYRVEFSKSAPSVYTHIPAYDREPRDQVRQTVVVPRGNRFATWIRVERRDFGGPMNLSFEGLPEGVTFLTDTIPAEVDRLPVVFEAKADAPVAGRFVSVIARHAEADKSIEGGFHQEVNLIYGQPNNTVYFRTDVNRLAVAVAEEAPFSLRIVESKAPLAQNGSAQLKVVAERKAGFDAPIELRLLWTPPGMGASGTVTLAKGQTEADYPVNAGGNAPLKTWKMVVLGSAETGRGLSWVSTQPAPLTVVPPYLAAKIEMATAAQGATVDLVCKLEQLRPFEGKAKLAIQGLPPLVVAEAAEQEITKDSLQAVFRVKIDPKSPAGQHKSLFASVTVLESGEPVLHSTAAGGVLRIDPPAAPRKDGPKADAGTAAPVAPKPVGRLEQLRRDAAEKENR